MTWSYSGDPRTTSKDAVRVKIGDTVSTDPQLQDEEIEYFLEQYSGASRPEMKASIEAARSIAAKYARESTYRIGQVSETLSRKAEAYERLVDDLTEELRHLVLVSASMVAHKVADKAEAEADSTLVDANVRIGMHDNK